MSETIGLVCVEALERVGGWDAMKALDTYLDGEWVLAVAADDRQGWASVLCYDGGLMSLDAIGRPIYRLVLGTVEFKPKSGAKALEWGRLASEYLRALAAGVDLRPKV